MAPLIAACVWRLALEVLDVLDTDPCSRLGQYAVSIG